MVAGGRRPGRYVPLAAAARSKALHAAWRRPRPTAMVLPARAGGDPDGWLPLGAKTLRRSHPFLLVALYVALLVLRCTCLLFINPYCSCLLFVAPYFPAPAAVQIYLARSAAGVALITTTLNTLVRSFRLEAQLSNNASNNNKLYSAVRSATTCVLSLVLLMVHLAARSTQRSATDRLLVG